MTVHVNVPPPGKELPPVNEPVTVLPLPKTMTTVPRLGLVHVPTKPPVLPPLEGDVPLTGMGLPPVGVIVPVKPLPPVIMTMIMTPLPPLILI